MIQKSPKLLCNTLLLFSLLFLGTNMVAQMDLETANIIVAYEGEGIDAFDSNENEELVLFKESGKGQLQNGSAEIKIDPEIAEKIEGKKINDLVTVTIQMEGKSNGVYVSRKNRDTFVLTEMDSGNSNSYFSYKFTVSSPQ